MEYPPILTKSQFIREYKKGTFGNHSPTWNTVKELKKDNYNGRVHLRSRMPGGVGYYNLSVNQAIRRWFDVGSKEWYCSGMAPHNRNLIQGELLVDAGWHLTYSDEPDLPMRDALAKSTKTATGVLAYNLVKSAMCPNSWEWLQVLLSRYEGHVIEFSCFSIPWGTLPHHNTCFWEIRIGY